MTLPKKRAFDDDGDTLITENDQQTNDRAEGKVITEIRKDEKKTILSSSTLETHSGIFSIVDPSETISVEEKTTGMKKTNLTSPSGVLQSASNTALHEHTSGTVMPATNTSESEADEMQQRKNALLASIWSTSQQDGQIECSINSNLQSEEIVPERQISQPESHNLQGLSSHSKHAKYINGSYNRKKNNFNELWYQDYYDPSFIDNPWETLEKANGLQPTNNWIKRGS